MKYKKNPKIFGIFFIAAQEPVKICSVAKYFYKKGAALNEVLKTSRTAPYDLEGMINKVTEQAVM